MRSSNHLPIILAGLLAITVACDSSPDPRLAPATELQGAVVFMLDTVRHDHLSSMGHVRPTSPILGELADEGVAFEQVVSYAPWTLPSMVSMLSGTAFELAFGRGMEHSIVESIRDAGYATAAITEGGFVTKRFGLDRGFETFVEEKGPVQLLTPGQVRDSNFPGGIESTFRQAKQWITEHQDERFFLFVHTYEPHTPYTRTQFVQDLDRGNLNELFQIEDLSRVRRGDLTIRGVERKYLSALYDGGIRESDRHVGTFLAHLENVGLRDRTLIVVTSDHGEELGDHFPSHAGDHGHALYDDQLLVPLILHNPIEDYPVRRVVPQVRTMDIFPTIADLLGVPVRTGLGGVNLLELMRGEDTDARIAYGGIVDAGPERRFVRYLGYKYIEVTAPQNPRMPPLARQPPRIQLFDLSSDPGEQHNLAGERTDLVERFHGMLQETLRGGQAAGFELPDDVDEETKERLRSLGYLR